MEDQVITPWDAYRNFVEDLTFSDFFWLAIGLFLMWVLYFISTIQVERRKLSWKDPVKFFAGLGCWAFCLIAFGFKDINPGGIPAYTVLGMAGIISLTSVLIFARRSHDWKKIAHASIVIFIGFGMAVTFVINKKALCYAIVFGFSLGVLLALIFRTLQALKNPILEEGDSTHTQSFKDEWDI